jgi:Family of unknown function (DUF5343)
MALTSAYLVTTKNLEAFFNSLQSAKAPERFTTKFLTQLDLTSSNDRLFIGLLKGLGFIDEGGVPTKRYFEFLDQTQAPRILAEALRDAYSDLFAINKNAQALTVDEVKNKLRTLTLGQKSDKVVSLMANTFKALVDLADWESPSVERVAATHAGTTEPPPPAAPATTGPPIQPATTTQPAPTPLPPSQDSSRQPLQLHYDIQIHLPESRDPAVFDAIFQALRKHLT